MNSSFRSMESNRVRAVLQGTPKPHLLDFGRLKNTIDWQKIEVFCHVQLQEHSGVRIHNNLTLALSREKQISIIPLFTSSATLASLCPTGSTAYSPAAIRTSGTTSSLPMAIMWTPSQMESLSKAAIIRPAISMPLANVSPLGALASSSIRF